MIRVKRKTITMIVRFFIAIIVVFGVKILSEMWKEGAFITVVTQYPKESFVVIVDLDQQEKFFEQLKRFSDFHDFGLHIGQTTPTGNTFNIEMTGKNVSISGNNVLNSTRFEIAFYDKYPANPVSEEAINSLISELKRFISEVPNVRIFD